MAPRFPKKRRAVRKRKSAPKVVGKRRPALRRRPAVPRSIKIRHYNGQISESACSLVMRRSRQVELMNKMAAPTLWIDSVNATILTGSATQNYGSFTALNNTLVKTIVQSAPGGGGGVPKRIAIESADFNYLIANNTNVPVEFDIYDIVPKRDILQSLSFNANGFTYPCTPYPEVYWAQGSCAQNGVAGTTNPAPSELLGSIPQDSRLFLEYFTIKRKTVVHLPMSGAHRHNVHIKANVIADDYLANPTTSAMVGRSSFMMIVVRGMPCFATPAGGANQSTTSSATLNVVQTVRVKYNWLANSSYNLASQTHLASVLPANQNTFNQGNGAAQLTNGFPIL